MKLSNGKGGATESPIFTVPLSVFGPLTIW